MSNTLSTPAEFIQAVQAGAYDRAAAALPTLTGRHDESLRRAIADLQAHQRNWSEAAASLNGLNAVDAKLRATLYRNLAALKTHRPFIYRSVLAEIERPTGTHRAHALPDGQLTVARLDVVGADAAGRVTPLVNDPAAQVRAAAGRLQAVIDAGQPLAFFSIGDGHVVADVAARPPKLFMDRQQALYVIEPDVGLLVACLLVHDFTGPLGPIEQPRVAWYVGPKWLDAMRLDLLTDPCLLFPQTNVKQGPSGRVIEDGVASLLGHIAALDTAAAAEVAKHYAPLTADDHARALRGQAGRPARVLLLTTRFSTVLQYSTRDAESGLRRIGCDTMVLIERAPHLGMTRLAMRRALAEFKPDLIFQIDHHRFEHADLFPVGVPFVNWIQDLLPHLMTPTAGRKLAATDFVLTPSKQRWTDEFAYPDRQCLEFRKLTRVPGRPTARCVNDARVVYVSNWGRPPAAIRDQMALESKGTERDVIVAACDAMTAEYAAGRSLPTPGDVRRVLLGVMDAVGATADGRLVGQTTTKLADRLNNALYRQQGLAWAAESCRRLGLTLEIYGNGWDALPPFAAHARGPIEYGPALERLAREAAINLVLEPFMCTAHQRMLDALAAGGFCLVRDHPTHHTTDAWIELLARAGGTAATAASLGDVLKGEDRRRFERTLAECERIDGTPQRIDHVATVARLQAAGFLPKSGPMLPLLDRVTFDTPDALTQKIARAAADPVYRTDVSATQRRAVEQRYGYPAGMGVMLTFVADRLAAGNAVRRAA